MGTVNYRRHFAALVLAAGALVLLEATGHRGAVDDHLYYGVVGLLHSACWIAGLPRRASWIRRLVFVTAATIVSVAIPYLALVVDYAVGYVFAVLPFEIPPGPRVALFFLFGIGSAVGSFGYWRLIRAVWMPRLRWQSTALTVGMCVAATLVSLFIVTFAGLGENRSLLYLPTVSWWFAFSVSLWLASRQPNRFATGDWRLTTSG